MIKLTLEVDDESADYLLSEDILRDQPAVGYLVQRMYKTITGVTVTHGPEGIPKVTSQDEAKGE